MIGLILLLLIVVLVLLKVYAFITLGRCKSERKLNGKTVLITGANRGMGYQTALNMAERGARVIITSENTEAINRAREQLIQETGNENIVAKYLDLSSLALTRKFAEEILNTEDRLDILVNNAGTCGLGPEKTKDDILPSMQVNYIGPFLLTNLLVGLLKKSAPSRIVNVASILSEVTWLDENNINTCPSIYILYELFVYGNSKLCTVLATMELAKRLKSAGVTVNCLHPGVVHTAIFRELKMMTVTVLTNLLSTIYFKTIKEGAQTTIHLAACESVEGETGKYYSDCRESYLWANTSDARRKKVWDQSILLAKLKPEEIQFDKDK